MAPLEKLRYGVNSRIHLSLPVIDSKIVIRELLGPTYPAEAQTFYINKPSKVVMIYEHKNLVLAALQVVAPDLKDFNNSQELLIVNFIPSFCQNHLSGEKNY